MSIVAATVAKKTIHLKKKVFAKCSKMMLKRRGIIPIGIHVIS